MQSKYDKLQSEFTIKIHKLEQDLASANDVEKKIDDDKKTVEAKLEACEKEIAQLKDDHSKLQTKKENHRFREDKMLQKRAESLVPEQRLIYARAASKELELGKQIDKDQKLIDAKLEAFTKESAQLKDEYSKLNANKETCAFRLKLVHAELEARTKESAQLKEEYTKLQATKETCSFSLELLNFIIAHLKGNIESETSKSNDLEKENRKLREKIIKLEARLDHGLQTTFKDEIRSILRE